MLSVSSLLSLFSTNAKQLKLIFSVAELKIHLISKLASLKMLSAMTWHHRACESVYKWHLSFLSFFFNLVIFFNHSFQ